jgi:signal transduction histidine kinase
MIKVLVFVFLLCLTCSDGFAQTKEAVDSLQHQLAIAKDDTSRINAQIALCLLYRLGNTDSSLAYGRQALESSRRINYLPGQIGALGFMCIVTEQQGNLPKSLELGFKALQLAEDYHLESLSGPALDGIAEAYIILKEYSKATTYLHRYLLVGRSWPTAEGLAYAYFDMGVAYAGLNQFDLANFYEEKSLETFRKYNREEPLVYQTLGDIRMKSPKPEDALRYYREGLDISLRKNERRASAYAYNRIASFYMNTKNPDSAIFYAKKGLEISQIISQKKTILDAATILSELYEQKDPRQAFSYLRMANAYKDSLFGTSNIQAIQVIASQEEEHQKQIEAAKIQYRNQLRQYALIAGLTIVIVIAFILYRNNLQKLKANKVLEKTLSDLKSAQAQLIQSEKMASLGELTAGIAHEIQNPLNFVNNFSDVNTELIDEADQEIDKGNIGEVKIILNDIKENEQKINLHGKRADSIVKGMLQHSRTSSVQKELTDINKLADEYLRLSYHGMRAKDKSFNAEFKTDFDENIGKVNVVPQDIGRVLLNSYNNAFYAVNDKKKTTDEDYQPSVSVQTKKLNGKIEIKVSDNGNGIPQNIVAKIFQPFFTTKPTGQGTGLGLSLSYDIIKAHSGEIKVETKEGEGSEFIIQLPVI